MYSFSLGIVLLSVDKTEAFPIRVPICTREPSEQVISADVSDITQSIECKLTYSCDVRALCDRYT